jgi:hypothetical protein
MKSQDSVSGFIIRDPTDIRPARPISSTEINEVVTRFTNAAELGFWDQMEELMEIGFKFRCWHDLFDSEEGWNIWRRTFLPMFPQEIIGLCLRAWDNNEKIKNVMRARGIPIKYFDPVKIWPKH